jgi:hypothetical protein
MSVIVWIIAFTKNKIVLSKSNLFYNRCAALKCALLQTPHQKYYFIKIMEISKFYDLQGNGKTHQNNFKPNCILFGKKSYQL